ncbi:unnamed protein product [Clavelina lepadiformis]|uniref:Uncharacterized protein n=1 Tax=Clavelina lepadiformis TaxID=159417 RepID=A0ABP0H025_CLALP
MKPEPPTFNLPRACGGTTRKQSAGRNSHRQQSDEPSGGSIGLNETCGRDDTYNDILNDWVSIHDGLLVHTGRGTTPKSESAGRNSHRQQSDEPSGGPSD